jgi:small subunit ribosomal protein S6
VRRYETIFILRSDLGEPQVKDSIKRFEGLVAAGGGEMLETDEWGFRELAYRIHNERRGYYVRLDYAATGPVMNEVERNLRISDTVLRYLSVLVDDNADVAKAREELEARNRRIAEAKAAQEARAAALMASREERPVAAEEAPDAPEEIMEAAAEEIAGPEGDREPD